MTPPPERSKVAAVVLLAALLAGCSSGTPAAAPGKTTAPASTSVATPSPTYDDATRTACTNAIDTSADTEDKHAREARSWAELSDVPTLREIAVKYARGTDSEGIELAHLFTAQSLIDTWCIQHGLG